MVKRVKGCMMAICDSVGKLDFGVAVILNEERRLDLDNGKRMMMKKVCWVERKTTVVFTLQQFLVLFGPFVKCQDTG